MTALRIRKDRTPAVLRKLAATENNARVARRLLGIANALSGMSRAAAAKAAGMTGQSLRDWVIRYNEAGVKGLMDRWGNGRPSCFNDDELAQLADIILQGPAPEEDGISAYTLEDLANIAQEKWNKSIHPASMSRVVRGLGFSRQKSRPSNPKKDEAALEAFKKGPCRTFQGSCIGTSR